ncbi:hypothetical protein J5N97_028096 [Dioscorea zingiberensis]|uniref:Uncharacterized protein n=1 Tax=Dioscorea zingiberensis TaxID=325984 RepID=A0A9D5H4K4_9LILI|nr:hypothetical protein J5N97_028096 [Dioscorea zingiberensis]
MGSSVEVVVLAWRYRLASRAAGGTSGGCVRRRSLAAHRDAHVKGGRRRHARWRQRRRSSRPAVKLGRGSGRRRRRAKMAVTHRRRRREEGSVREIELPAGAETVASREEDEAAGASLLAARRGPMALWWRDRAEWRERGRPGGASWRWRWSSRELEAQAWPTARRTWAASTSRWPALIAGRTWGKRRVRGVG